MPSTTDAEGPSAGRINGWKVLIISDMDVDGIFNWADQCNPLKSPRWQESQKLLAGELRAAAEALLHGSTAEVAVWDGQDGGESFSASPTSSMLINDLHLERKRQARTILWRC